MFVRNENFMRRVVFIGLLLFIFHSFIFAQAKKNPVIIVPGLLGSELVNKTTNEKVWLRLSRSKDDDLRLPISPNLIENRDNLVPTDILREVKLAGFKLQDIYKGLIETLKANGWNEATWEEPKAENAFYVFAYDWRLDNIENAKLLVQRVEAVKEKLQRPDLKFDVIAHSMGGLITQYAVMYGAAEPPQNFKPTWAGKAHFRKIFLIGTPNKGSALALRALLRGFSPLSINFNINVPFVQNLTVFDLFTVQSLYQLLPDNASLKIYDETLKPIKLDVYDPSVWETYGWSVFGEKDLQKEFSDMEAVRGYLRAVLQRAKTFRTALNAGLRGAPVQIFKIGAECKQTPDGALLYREKDEWKLIFEAKGLSFEDGRKLSSKEVQRFIFSSGDGVVSKASLLGNGSAQDVYMVCKDHDKLVADRSVQSYIIQHLKRTTAKSNRK